MSYNLVLSGPLEWSGTAPHINGNITISRGGDGQFDYQFIRDGFPWAEAYFYDGQGNTNIIFQDAAIRGNPHDLFAIEPNISPFARAIRTFQNLRFGPPQISRKN